MISPYSGLVLRPVEEWVSVVLRETSGAQRGHEFSRTEKKKMPTLVLSTAQEKADQPKPLAIHASDSRFSPAPASCDREEEPAWVYL